MLCAFAALLLPSALSALGRQETTMIWLEPYRVPVAAWDGPWMADRITFQDGKAINWIWGIEGFDEYEWGMSCGCALLKKRKSFPVAPSGVSSW